MHVINLTGRFVD